MKTLYLTDLDGTFLNSKAQVSSRSKQILNMLCDNDILFTIASARTFATVIPMFTGVSLRNPLVLMNGVC
ncbi:MAG: HAD family hydrolase, partial [Muribaculaceae bacterium]|nr:HAD family hydrolase [Muribaculaceae bacterium]